MATPHELTLFHAPNSRSSAALLLLEEIGAPYTLRQVDIRAGEQRQPAYRAVNPMGKVPALRHGDAVVTELVAIFLHLADLFPEAGLAPPPGDTARGPYLRWMVTYASCFEPAVVDRALKRGPGDPTMSPYGDYDTVLAMVVDQVSQGPWLLGDRFTAADVLWGGGLAWTMEAELVPPLPEIAAYCARWSARPAVARARAKDAALAARRQEAPVC